MQTDRMGSLFLDLLSMQSVSENRAGHDALSWGWSTPIMSLKK